MRKKLSTSVYTFRTIIQENGLYVDKTQDIYRMVTALEGQFFLSRPRRFGKSLTLSTLESVFRGEKDLFRGLYIHDQEYDWKPYPIIRISLNACSASCASELDRKLSGLLDDTAEDYGVAIKGVGAAERFRGLIRSLSRDKGMQVVILIDEYDKPILDNILDREEVLKIRTLLKQFYGMIKAMEENIRFSFITGVSKFTQVSIFSDLNHLDDMTLMPEYATICGFTQEECEQYFAQWIDENAVKNGLSRDAYLDKVRRIYNGLRFSEKPVSVYNPVSFIKAMDQGGFRHYWFETGTPTFLLRLLREQEYPVADLDGMKLTSDSFSSYEIDRLRVEPLLFQTGYLTIIDYEADSQLYTLGYPNEEVRMAFVKRLSDYFTPVPEARVPDLVDHLHQAFRAQDLKGVFEVLAVFYARVDYSIRLRHEKYYQTIFYILFTLLGYRIQVEASTGRGRMDAVIQTEERIYIFEFKMNMSAHKALDQIRQKDYFRKYLLDGKPLTLVGVSFNADTGEIAEWVAVDHASKVCKEMLSGGHS